MLLQADSSIPAIKCEHQTIVVQQAAADSTLALWARRFREQGRLKAWRNELLPVAAIPELNQTMLELPVPLACVERSAARVLGILTHAVHLVGFSQAGDVWLQQRAHNKATDPGLWDTLSGGLLSVGDSLIGGVYRETQEEAGLTAEQLSPLVAAGCTVQDRLVADGRILEAVWTFTSTLASQAVPHNLDGEAIGFECLNRAQLAERVQQGLVTHEAQLALHAAGLVSPHKSLI